MKQPQEAGVNRTMKDSIKKRQAQLISRRYGNPGQSVKVVAVVGTNGKTTTAHYLNEMLLNNDQSTALLVPEEGVTLGVRRVQQFLREAKRNNVKYAIIVIGCDDIRAHSLGSASLETVVMTNFSDTRHEMASEQLDCLKRLLERTPRYMVLNHDDESCDELSDVQASSKMSYGVHEDAEAHIEDVTLYKKGSELKLVIDHQTKLRLATYLVGTANVLNLTAAVTALYIMGESIADVDEGAARLESCPTNYEYITTALPYRVVLDAAPNDTALQQVVATTLALAPRRTIVAVQADSLSEACIEEVGEKVDRLIVIDINDFKPNRGTVERVVSPDAAVKLALRAARQDDVVVFAGPIYTHLQKDGRSYVHNAIDAFLQD